MAKYLFKRILYGVFSIVVVVAIVMIMIYSLMNLGTLYIIFIIAVPSLAYIFMFKAMGSMMGFPTNFNMDSPSKLMYVLPIVSLALPSVANLMKWLRRYMIDQMNSDMVIHVHTLIQCFLTMQVTRQSALVFTNMSYAHLYNI